MMQPLTQVESVRNAIHRIQGKAKVVHSNFFAASEELRSWIERGCMFYMEAEHALLILRRDRNFSRLYHVATSPEMLSAELDSMDRVWDASNVLVSDLVGRPEDIDPASRTYREHGFTELRSLCRMTRTSKSPIQEAGDGPEVVFGQSADVAAIADFLERMLNPYADQIPATIELQTAVARKQILIAGGRGTIAGLLFFDSKGQTAHIRYWYVGENCRNQGIGARLMKTFLSECRDARRIILWVVSENADAIAKYSHYGFEREGLVDQIMIRGTP